MAFSIIGWPVGIFLGFLTASLIRNLLTLFLENPLFSLGGFIVSPIMIYLILRWSIKPGDTEPKSVISKVLRILIFILTAVLFIATLLFLETLSRSVGLTIVPLGIFGFIGNFLYQIGEASPLLIPAVTSFVKAAGVGGTLG